MTTVDHVHDLANGQSNGYGNGHANGHASGHANGHANGHVNGHVNGHTNGHTNGHANGRANGHANGNGSVTNGDGPAAKVYRSRLAAAAPDEVQDLVCVGFGPASLAVAVALHDALEAGTLTRAPRVLFLEKQGGFAWHAGMLLPGARMQISFIKDLASLRNPRSAFTFVNYLHEHGRLVEFTNLDTFLPARAEYEDYLRWCARWFDASVLYGREVTAVCADAGVDAGAEAAAAGADAPVSTFRVAARDSQTGAEHVYRARNVLLAVGGKPSLPASLPAAHPRVVHSSQYCHIVPPLLGDAQAACRVAVVGAGQSAAEIFNSIQTQYPSARTALIMRAAFLRPSDDSPFINSIFNPDYIDHLYPQSARYRRQLLAEARPTNYGVVRLELIDALYERMYHQRRLLGPDETAWPHRILAGRRVARVEASPDGKDKDRLRLVVVPDDDADDDAPTDGAEELDVDLVIAATGYERNAHVTMLKGLWPLLPAADSTDAADDVGAWHVNDTSVPANPHTRSLRVARDYHVEFAPGQVAAGSGVWLQGSCEGTHGLSDTLLSVLATRSGEIVETIFGDSRGQK